MSEAKQETKKCKECGRDFPREKDGKRIGDKQWFIRTYCSPECSRKNRNREIYF